MAAKQANAMRLGLRLGRLLAALLALLALAPAIVGPVVSLARHADVAAGIDAPCRADRETSPASHSPGRESLSCCILCMAAAGGALPFRLPDGVAYAHAATGCTALFFCAARPGATRPSGWGSVWSAQAPPVFS